MKCVSIVTGMHSSNSCWFSITCYNSNDVANS